MGVFDWITGKSWKDNTNVTLDVIRAKLQTIDRRLIEMSSQESALDDALNRLSDGIESLKSAVQAVVDKLSQQAPEVDLSDETAAVDNATDALSAAAEALASAGSSTTTEPPADGGEVTGGTPGPADTTGEPV